MERKYYLDFVRAIAILLVVVNHSIEHVFPFYSGSEFFEVSCVGQFFQFSMFTLGRLGVPLFFMLTGYLLVARQYDTRSKILNFYKKNLLGLYVLWCVWIVLYNVFLYYYDDSSIVLKDLLLECLLIKAVPLMHSWYMRDILLIYVFLPFLSIVLNKIRIKRVLVIIISILCLQIVNSAFGGIRYYGFITMKLMYVAYIIWGYYLSKSVIHINKIVSSIVFIVFFGGLVVYQVQLSNMGEIYSVWYSNPAHYISSIFLSLILFRSDSCGKMFFLEKISNISFGIYLVHVPIMKIIQSGFPFLAIPSVLNFVYFFVLSLMISAILILVIMKVPIVGKKLFYIK